MDGWRRRKTRDSVGFRPAESRGGGLISLSPVCRTTVVYMVYRPLTITVKYSCLQCGLYRAECAVPARGDEDVLEWMNQTIIFLAQDHAARSPSCHPASLHDVRIPFPESADRIGGPSRQ